MRRYEKREKLREQLFKLSCDDQFWLATVLAENLGYVLTGEMKPDIIFINDKRYKLVHVIDD